jgi:hypothetical protein
MKSVVSGFKLFGRGGAILIIGTSILLAIVLGVGVPYNIVLSLFN